VVGENRGGDARWMAAQALGFLGQAATKRTDVMNALKKAAKDPDAELRKWATESLEKLGVK
jgi:hypothetical protein